MLGQYLTRNAFFYSPLSPPPSNVVTLLGLLKKIAMTGQLSLWKLVIGIQNTNVHWQRYFVICPRI